MREALDVFERMLEAPLRQVDIIDVVCCDRRVSVHYHRLVQARVITQLFYKEIFSLLQKCTQAMERVHQLTSTRQLAVCILGPIEAPTRDGSAIGSE